MVEAYHGIAAYRGGLDPISLRVSAAGCLGNEVCVADRPIGVVGLIVKGRCRAVFDRDVWSEIASDGRRACDYTPGLEHPDFDTFVDFAANAHIAAIKQHRAKVAEFAAQGWKIKEQFNHRRYCEGWLTPSRVVAVWVKPHASPRVRRFAAMEALQEGVPLRVLKGTHRIWDDHASWSKWDQLGAEIEESYFK